MDNYRTSIWKLFDDDETIAIWQYAKMTLERKRPRNHPGQIANLETDSRVLINCGENGVVNRSAASEPSSNDRVPFRTWHARQGWNCRYRNVEHRTIG
jgi:hypothetical protein